MNDLELGQLLGRLEESQVRMEQKLDKAIKEKIDRTEVVPLIRKTAVKWALGVGSAIVLAAQVAQALGLLP